MKRVENRMKIKKVTKSKCFKTYVDIKTYKNNVFTTRYLLEHGFEYNKIVKNKPKINVPKIYQDRLDTACPLRNISRKSYESYPLSYLQ